MFAKIQCPCTGSYILLCHPDIFLFDFPPFYMFDFETDPSEFM